ncbi:MAG: hypothetical protein COA84_04290 [Robiginitomaculum sp.]|nr:MAG: hypothetical protein COA84_04290 [Robiginitomaculum sp.]
MILRRVIKHFREQEWTAIFLDFLIVVVGVFVGLQVQNWNERRGDRAEYNRALDRLDVEISANLAMLDALDPQVMHALQIVEQAFEILQSCIESEENHKTIEDSFDYLQSTFGLHLQRNALKDLTENPTLLAQQSTDERKRFAEMLFNFDFLQLESDFVENQPFKMLMADIPVIGVGAKKNVSIEYYGLVFSNIQRRLFLKVPIDQACQNSQLIKKYYVWEVSQAEIPGLSKNFRQELEATKALLAARQ